MESISGVCRLVALSRLPQSIDVDTPEKPKRSWWRRKRWRLIAVLSVLLPPVFYPLSVGPALYFRYDGRLPKPVYAAVYDPLWAVHRALVPNNSPLTRYGHWWSELAACRHGDRSGPDYQRPVTPSTTRQISN